MSSATDLITEQLREAQAIEQSSLSLLQGHLRGAPPGPYRTAARRHLDETRRHAHQVAERLTSLGASRGPVGTVVTLGEAIAGRLAGAALAPLHLLTGRTRPDVLLRNVQDEIAAEAREVATYEALERLAEAAGDPATASLARAIRDDEQRFLDTLRALLGPLADRVARERLGGARPQPAPAPGSARSAPPEPEPEPQPAGRHNGGPVPTETETETPYADRAARLREARREAGQTPEGPTRAQAARLREEKREAERPVESEGPAAPAAEVHIEAPWDGYGTMKAGEIVERLRDANDTVRAMVRLYEQSTKNRKSILAATEP